ncbi:hypothetical protein BS50DRAFT_382996 [Corynespora cassiicola Philippines]|uniref:Uncharacterized protein n=1 Tax=Corynespora cassiicola Philippines TaxID=1448308 RepID=A0A2T2NNW2_CORCC|nr:hypothetical protein BS50DRAFT_382996 [Corynespora cassiicola Philippines]
MLSMCPPRVFFSLNIGRGGWMNGWMDGRASGMGEKGRQVSCARRHARSITCMNRSQSFAEPRLDGQMGHPRGRPLIRNKMTASLPFLRACCGCAALRCAARRCTVLCCAVLCCALMLGQAAPSAADCECGRTRYARPRDVYGTSTVMYARTHARDAIPCWYKGRGEYGAAAAASVTCWN